MREPLKYPSLSEDLLAVLTQRLLPRSTILDPAPVTARLRLQMTEADRRRVRAAVPKPLQAALEQLGEPARTQLELAATVGVAPREIPERSGLPHVDVADGLTVAQLVAETIDAAGADVVVAALEAAGVPLSGVTTILDTGTGAPARLRALALARPGVRAVGNGLPDVCIAFDAFARGPGETVRELVRLHERLGPGGRLVTTVPGLHAFAGDLASGNLSGAQAASAARALYRSGRHDMIERTYVTLEWITAWTLAPWALLVHAIGAGPDDVDVLVLERRSP